MTHRKIILLSLVGFIAFLSGGWLLQRDGQAAGVYRQARLFDNVVAYVADFYVDSLSEQQIYDMAIDGLLRELEDPYTTFLRPDDLRELTVSTTGNYGGLGIRIEIADGWITVVAPLPETPAERAGMQSGDRIVEVDGTSTHRWSMDQAVRELRGEPGSRVRITVVRPGVSEPLRFTIAREQIHVKSIGFASMLEGGVGYVQLTQVSAQSARELEEEIDRLREQGARALILDMRTNPGGLLDEGIAVTDLFLPRGEVVVETRGRAPDATATYRARTDERWPDMPLAVLVNGASASATEIIAGALQDHDRALILGTQTFGKGLVQTVYQLGPAQALKLTTGRWYTPSGRVLERPKREQGLALAELDDEPTAADTVPLDSLPTYRTDGGRTVYGGGGIRPDVLVPPDTLTAAEQAFGRALGGKIPAYRDVMSTYSLDLKGRNAVTDPAFEVTPAMLAEFHRRLTERGVHVPDSVWHGARALVSRQLGYEITRHAFGREMEIRRQVRHDRQIAEAAALLRRADSPQALFALAAQQPVSVERN